MDDRTLRCVECGQEFVFTAGEQAFFAQQGFRDEPKRCKACRARRQVRSGQAWEIVCSRCGERGTVPFPPTPGRSLLCGGCHRAQRGIG